MPRASGKPIVYTQVATTRDAERPKRIPTQSVGTRSTQSVGTRRDGSFVSRSHAPRGNALWTLCVPYRFDLCINDSTLIYPSAAIDISASLTSSRARTPVGLAWSPRGFRGSPYGRRRIGGRSPYSCPPPSAPSRGDRGRSRSARPSIASLDAVFDRLTPRSLHRHERIAVQQR